jgi:hypothetical protein
MTDKRARQTWRRLLLCANYRTGFSANLLDEALFGAQAQDAVYRVGCAVGGGVEVSHLKLAEQTDAHHLDSGQDEHACDDEERPVERHDVLVGNDLENEQPRGHAEASHHAERSDGPEEVQRARHITQQEADGEEVEEDAEGAGDAVVALAKLAGGIRDGNLADAGAVPGGEGGNETVHLAVKRDVLDYFAAVGFEGSTEVVDVYAAESGHEPVRGAGGYPAHDEVVATMRAPPAHNVVAFFELGEEAGDLVGIVLQVAVHGKDEVALGVVEAGSEGGGLAEVAAELDDQDTAVYCGDLFEEAVGAVAGSIVDEDQLEGLVDMLHDCLEAVVESGDILFFVMKRYDDRVFRHVLYNTPLFVLFG